MMLAALAAIGTQAFTAGDYMLSAPVAVSWATTAATNCNITIAGSSDASKNTLTTSDISNSMSASASSSGTSVGTNMMDGQYAMGKAVAGNLLNNGKASQSDASMTTSAISAAQVKNHRHQQR
jgi:hypothetical protein